MKILYFMLVSLFFVSTIAVLQTAAETRTNGSYGNIIMVVEQYTSSLADATALNNITKTLVAEFAENIKPNYHIMMTYVRVHKLNLPDPEHFHTVFDNSLPHSTDKLTPTDYRSVVTMNLRGYDLVRKDYVAKLKDKLTPTGHGTWRFSPTGTSNQLHPQEPKSVLVWILSSENTPSNPVVINTLFAPDVKLLMDHITTFVITDHETRLRDALALGGGVPNILQHWFTSSTIHNLIDKIRKELAVSHRDCESKSTTPFCNEHGGICAWRVNTTVKMKGEGPIGKSCDVPVVQIMNYKLVTGSSCGFDPNNKCNCPTTCCEYWSAYDAHCTTLSGNRRVHLRRKLYKFNCTSKRTIHDYSRPCNTQQSEHECDDDTSCLTGICVRHKCDPDVPCIIAEDCPGRRICQLKSIGSSNRVCKEPILMGDLACVNHHTGNNKCIKGVETCHQNECRRLCSITPSSACGAAASDCEKHRCNPCLQNEACIMVGERGICMPMGQKLDGDACVSSKECHSGACLVADGDMKKVCTQHCKYCNACGVRCHVQFDQCPEATLGHHMVCKSSHRQPCKSDSSCTDGICLKINETTGRRACHRTCTPCLQKERFVEVKRDSGDLVKVCRWSGYPTANGDSDDKVRLKNTVQVHLQAGSQVETRTLKQLTFRNHQVNMGFRLRSIEGLKNGVRLVPKVRMVMPLIFGSALDRASEYIMDNITIRIGQSPMLWEMLERFKYEKWAVEFQIVYSCKQCPKNKYAVIVVLVKVDNQKKSNLVFQSKKGQLYFSPDQLIPYDRERYLLFKVSMDPKMEQAIEGKTAWFIMNQWLTIGKSDKDTV